MVTCPTPLGPGATRKQRAQSFMGYLTRILNLQEASSNVCSSPCFSGGPAARICVHLPISFVRERGACKVQEYQESSALIFCHERYDNILTSSSSSSSSSFYSHLFKKKKYTNTKIIGTKKEGNQS